MSTLNLNTISRDSKWSAVQILMAYDEYRDAFAVWNAAADKAQSLLNSENPDDAPFQDALRNPQFLALAEAIGKINESLTVDCPLLHKSKRVASYPVGPTLRAAAALRNAAKRLDALK